MVLILERDYSDKGVNGKLYLNQRLVCFTIELPWRNNQYRVSCIPEGKYTIRPRYTERFGRHLAVDNVPGRTSILLHTFNHALKESKGCIAPVCSITGEGQGISSRIALDHLLMLLKPALDKKETIFLIIQSTKNEHHQKSEKTDTAVL